MDYLYWGISLTLIVFLFLYWFTAPLWANKSKYIGGSKYKQIDINGSSKDPFHDTPAIEQPEKLFYSLIVPAYNESKRIGNMLNDYIDYLISTNKPFEILVVDDGSKDNTTEVALDIGIGRGCNLKVIKCEQNGGKGLAVKIGMLCALGRILIFADADNATKAICMADLEAELNAITQMSKGVAIGSRNISKQGIVKERSFIRNLLSLTANKVLKMVFATNVSDTQCGFKMFTRKAAREIFEIQHLERWAFDLEIIQICNRLNIQIAEVPVHWTEIPGSKFNLVLDLIYMLRDALLVRILYTTGYWSIKDRLV